MRRFGGFLTLLLLPHLACSSAITPEPRQSLSVAISGVGQGTITSQPAGIQCTGGGGVCSVSLPKGTQVTLRNSVTEGSSFLGWSEACSGIGECTVTLDADRTVGVRFGLGRLAAIARAREAVIDTLARDRFVLALASQEALPPGTKIFQSDAEPGEPPVMTSTGAATFIFVDLVPTYKYGHAVKYLLVDLQTGAVTVKRATALPKVNGQVLYRTFADRLFSPDRFEPATTTERLKPVMPVPDYGPANSFAYRGSGASRQVRSGSAGEPCRMVAVTVAAGGDGYIKNDAKMMGSLLGSLGFEVHPFDSAVDGLRQVGDGIENAAKDLGPCDKFLLYISAHTDLDDDDADGKPDGGRASKLLYGDGEATDGTWGLGSGGGTSSTIPDILSRIKAGTINVVLDVCFAESLILHMRQPARGIFQPQPGVTINVFAAADNEKLALGASIGETLGDFLQLTQSGSTYTEQLVDHIRTAKVDADGDGRITVAEVEDAFKQAHAKLAQSLPQAPQFASFSGPPLSRHALDITRSGTGTGTVRSDPAGIECGTDCEERYLAGTRVVMLAIAGDFSLFREWTGDCTGSLAVAPSIVIDRAKACDARFDLIPGYHQLSLVQVGGAFGDGVVTSQPQGIACGQANDRCRAGFPNGTAVKLTFAASLGSGASAKYGGSGTTDRDGNLLITVDADREVQVTYFYQLWVSTSGTGKGLVVDQPGGTGINCGDGGAKCLTTFPRGAPVPLEARPAAGSRFSKWTGDCIGTHPVTSVIMTRLRACDAEFAIETAAVPTLTPGIRSMGALRQAYRTTLFNLTLANLVSRVPLVGFGGETASGGGILGVYDLATETYVLQRYPPFYVFGVMAAYQAAATASVLFAWGIDGLALYGSQSPFGETPVELHTDIRIGDAVQAGGGAPSDAIVFTSRDLGVGFVRYNPQLGRFAVSEEVLPKAEFAGDLLWAYIDAADAPAVVLSRSTASRLYFHRRNGSPPTIIATGLGLTNNLRCLPPLCLVLPGTTPIAPIFLFDGRNPPTRATNAHLTVIPFEAALRRTTAGGVAALVVGRESGADRVVEIEFAATGAVVRVVPMAKPTACSGVNGAAYVPDGGGVAAVVSCTLSHNFFIERSALFPPP